MYRVGGCIGVGGTGIVFEAQRERDGATLVVKTLRPKFAHNADLVTRLKREAEVAQTVFHPGIVPVLDHGLLSDGSPFLVLKRLYGESLSRLQRRLGPLPVSETAVITMRVASILHAVHQAGYVHRDVKPEHVILDRNRRGELEVALLDFGVCASVTAPRDERERERGRVYGTPTYVSPEQACGNPDVNAGADLFGLGVTVFELLSGEVPFRASDVTQLLRAHHATGAMDEVVAKLLQRDPRARFPSARALTRALTPLVIDRIAAERRLANALQVGVGTQEGKITLQESVAA
jgi:serine/threonine-protein kinase